MRSKKTMRNVIFIFLTLFVFSSKLNADNKNLVAYWDFDETSGTLIKDVSGNNNNLKIVGDIKLVNGMNKNAAEFPGEKESFLISENNQSLNLSEEFTIEAWIKRTNSGTMWDAIISKGGDKKGFQLFHSEKYQNLVLYLNTDEQGYAPIHGNYINLDEWTFIAAVFDSKNNSVCIYQNETLVKKEIFKGKIQNFTPEFYVGRSTGFHSFRGILDEIKIYNIAFDSKQIVMHYNSNKPPSHNDKKPYDKYFENLNAIKKDDDKIILSFNKTEFFLNTDDGKSTETQIYIYRGEHKFNDMNSGIKNAKLIFSGKISGRNNANYEYTDSGNFSLGMTYYYWVSPDNNNFRICPAKVRIYNPDIWWSPEKIDNKIEELAKKFPDLVKIKVYGNTVKGKPIKCLLIGNAERKIVLIGAMHVSESGPELILSAVERIMAENPSILRHVGIAVLPCVTLDERERLLSTGYPLYLRKNANGVDLNRNFNAYWDEISYTYGLKTNDPKAETYRGPYPFSEPETKAISLLLADFTPLAVFSFHSVGAICNAFFLYTKYAAIEKNDTGYIKTCEEFAKAYAKGMYPEDYEKYYVVEGTGSQGTLGTYVYKKYLRPSFDLELDKYEKPRSVVYSDGVTAEIMEEFQKRHQKGIESVINLIIHHDFSVKQ